MKLALPLFVLLPMAALATPTVTKVSPGRDGDLLICSVRTRDLPGDAISKSLETGLPSAVEMSAAVLDPANEVLAANRVQYRITYDLWEQSFRIEGNGEDRRFVDIATLEEYLSLVPRIPVAPIPSLASSESLRIRVTMKLHPVAPRESERLDRWVAGDAPSRDRDVEDPDGREVSVSLGQVIRFFYRGAKRGAGDVAERLSPAFLVTELAHASPQD